MSILNKYFEKIYIINLERRSDRWDECSVIINKHNIICERFNAVDGSTLTGYEASIKNDMGCTLSHLELVKKCKADNTKSVLILEDDFELVDDIFSHLENFYNQLPEDYEWLYFSGSHMEDPIQVTENVYKVIKTLTTHAYALKYPIYDKIIDALSDSAQSSAVDLRLSKIQPNEKCYVFIPHLIYQRNSFSDIQNKTVFYTQLKDASIKLK